MIPNLDTWTIVLVGGWNPKIFRPEWVGKEVFDRKNIALEVPLSPGSSVLRYNSPEDSLVLIPSDDRLVIGIRKAEEPVLNKAAAIAKKVLDLLPYTPIGAIGVNFGFVEPSPPHSLISLFSLSDLDNLSSIACEVKQTKISRSVLFSDTPMNITLALVEGQVDIHLNFHHDLTTAARASEFLDGKVVEYLRLGAKLLKEAYGCKMEDAHAE
jgi:hypothetical protein